MFSRGIERDQWVLSILILDDGTPQHIKKDCNQLEIPCWANAFKRFSIKENGNVIKWKRRMEIPETFQITYLSLTSQVILW